MFFLRSQNAYKVNDFKSLTLGHSCAIMSSKRRRIYGQKAGISAADQEKAA